MKYYHFRLFLMFNKMGKSMKYQIFMMLVKLEMIPATVIQKLLQKKMLKNKNLANTRFRHPLWANQQLKN